LALPSIQPNLEQNFYCSAAGKTTGAKPNRAKTCCPWGDNM
jgi:hypothetical protein